MPLVWRRILLYGGLGLGVIAAFGALVVVYYIWQITRDLPSLEALENYQPPVTTRVYAGDGTLLGEYARERRIFVPITFVPKLVINAFTSAEDRNFFSHPGIDPSGIIRAAGKDVINVLEHKRLEGASTITQQVAKNILLNSEVKFSRKVREAILAVRIDATFSKLKILELYLNEIYLGENSYGVAAAALNYFGKSLDQLDVAEVAFLAALPKAPSNYDPTRPRSREAAIERRNWVIGQMENNGYITDAQAKAAIAEPLTAGLRPLGVQAVDVDYFVEEVRRLLYKDFGEKALYDGGLQVRSTLDTRLQNFAVSALRTGLVRYDRRHGWRRAVANIQVDNWQNTIARAMNQSGIDTWKVAVVLGFRHDNSTEIGLVGGSTGVIPFKQLQWARPEFKEGAVGASPTTPQQVLKIGDMIYVEPVGPSGEYGLRQVPEVNGAIVVMDPHTGRVLAMSGGFSYASSQFDRSMQAYRQPGSSFKPFVYAAALDNGYTPVSKVLDGPFEFNQGPGLGIWRPENFEKGHFLGMTTLRRGLELSRNVMTVRLANELGMDKVVPYADRFGAYDHLPPLLANSLGAGETTLMRMTTAYSEFVNGGKKISFSLVDRIQDRTGKTIWRHDARRCDGCNEGAWHGQQEPLLDDTREQIIDPRTAYQLVSMMEGVVQRGTGHSVSAVGKPLAGKTGTSSMARDTWFIGFSPDLAAGVFVGFDNPRSLGRLEQGATVSAPIFRDFMMGALQGVPPTPFRVAPGIELIAIDEKSGTLTKPGVPGSIMEAFKAGTEPGGPNAPGASMDIGGNTPAEGQTGTNPSDVGEGTGGLY